MSDVQKEIDQNYEAFEAMLPALLAQHRDKFALMKDRKIINFFTTADDAYTAASTFIKDNIFSIQQVSANSIDLGFYNYAIPVD